MTFFFRNDIFRSRIFKSKNVTAIKRARGSIAKLKEECQENFNGELKAK